MTMAKSDWSVKVWFSNGSYPDLIHVCNGLPTYHDACAWIDHYMKSNPHLEDYVPFRIEMAKDRSLG